MGLFNWINFTCECGYEDLGFYGLQSKVSVPNEYEGHDLDEVPLNIAHDLEGEVVCCEKCQRTYRLQLKAQRVLPKAVPMEMVKE